MIKPLNSALHCIRFRAFFICMCIALLSGCANITPPPGEQEAPLQTGGYRSLRIAEVAVHEDSTLQRIEVPDLPPVAKPIDLVGLPDDLFQRIRHGFAMPDLHDELVLHHQQWYMNRPDYMRRMVDRSSRYLYHIVDELEKRGMPMELALLPMVESAYNPMAYSRSKASGLWQFIPSTGKRYNLDQDWWKDERRDIVASTNAALDYLQSIYEMHGDWHLALASYNWGEGAVGRAIGKNRAQGLPTDYLSLTMPQETRNYVPKLQALKNIFNSPSVLAQLDLPSIPNRPFFTTVTTESHIDVNVAAKLAEMPVQEFVALNPAHNRPVIKPETPLVIPAEKIETFVSNLEAHEEDKKPLSAWQTYTFSRGDTLAKIAKRFGMTLASLRVANGIGDKERVTQGRTLLVNGRSTHDSSTPRSSTSVSTHEIDGGGQLRESAGQTVTHTVAKGESLFAIARRYGTTVDALKKVNELPGSSVSVGTRLQVPAAARPRMLAATSTQASGEAGAGEKGATKTKPGSANKASGKQPKTTRYTVRRGDTLYSIAQQFKVDTDDLLRWNRISPKALRPGTTLTIQLAQNP